MYGDARPNYKTFQVNRPTSFKNQKFSLMCACSESMAVLFPVYPVSTNKLRVAGSGNPFSE